MCKISSKLCGLAITSLSLVSFFSCASDSDMDITMDIETDSRGEIMVSVADTDSVVTAEKAASIATKYAFRNFASSRSGDREIGEVYDVNDSDGNVMMYIVNFADNRGFVIVSATKGYYPILAQSDTGHFGIPAPDHPASVWLRTQKQCVANCDQLPAAIKSEIVTSWSEYSPEQPLITGFRSGYPDIPQIYYDSLKMWTISGQYTGVYKYKDFIQTYEYANLAQEEKQQIANNMHMYGNACYGSVEDVTIVLVGNHNEYFDYPRQLLQSEWGQYSPFNSYLPTMTPLGCTTIAAGQIMRYHQWPQNYDWNNIPISSDVFSDIRAKFLYELAKNIGVSFSQSGSGATLQMVQVALNREGYQTSIQNHNESIVLSELRWRRPVLMGGINENSDGHTWVCDGVDYYHYKHFIRVMSLEYRPTTYSIPPMIEVSKHETINSTTCRYHMNWGYDGAGNGYFNDNNISFKLGKECKNYNIRRMELTLKPNK